MSSGNLELPPKIHGLLSNGLVPAGLPETTTYKFLLENHPDLLVRRNLDTDMGEMREAKTAWNRLGACGVSVLPSRIVKHGEEVYVVTKRVEGIDLDTALRNNPSNEVISAVDQTWKSIVDHFADCRKKRKKTAGDAYAPSQYMLGTISGDDKCKVRYVDLSPYTIDFQEGMHYDDELLFVANTLIDLETASDRRLLLARSALTQALDLGGKSEQFDDSLKNAARFVLNQCQQIDPCDADTIETFRSNQFVEMNLSR